MGDFQSEYRGLLTWYEEQLVEADKLPDGPGHDGPASAEKMRIGAEYRKKLKALRGKYGVEPPPEPPPQEIPDWAIPWFDGAKQ